MEKTGTERITLGLLAWSLGLWVCLGGPSPPPAAPQEATFWEEAARLAEQGRTDELEVLIREKTVKDPQFLDDAGLLERVSQPSLLILLGGRQLERSRPKEALSFFQKACALAPSYDGFYGAALALYTLQDFAGARSQLRRAIELRQDSFEAHYLLGACLVFEGRNLEAVHAWRKAHRLSPDHLPIVKLLALQYLQGQYYREAVSLLQPAVAESPGDVELHVLLIQALHNAMNYVPALEQARKAVSLFPDHPRAHLELAIQLYHLGRLDESRSHFEKCLTLDSGEITARYYLGDLLLKEGRYEGATARFRESLQGQPDNLDAYIGLAKALLSLEEYREAISVLNRAIQVDASDSRIYFQLSRAYEYLGDGATAALQAKIYRDVREKERGRHEMTGGREFPSPGQEP